MCRDHEARDDDAFYMADPLKPESVEAHSMLILQRCKFRTEKALALKIRYVFMGVTKKRPEDSPKNGLPIPGSLPCSLPTGQVTRLW